ncbi:MAG: cell division topological specificity factor MinE [Granulosicoccus sp.]
MGFFKFFKSRSEDSSASVAKDRLQVLIAHERTGRNGPDYLPMLKQDILDVIKKYVSVNDDALTVQLDSNDDCDVLELNITLPEVETNEIGKVSPEARRRAELRRKALNQTS